MAASHAAPAPLDAMPSPALFRSLHKQAAQGLQAELTKSVAAADVNAKDDYSA
jgi:hypothetical protein